MIYCIISGVSLAIGIVIGVFCFRRTAGTIYVFYPQDGGDWFLGLKVSDPEAIVKKRKVTFTVSQQKHVL